MPMPVDHRLCTFYRISASLAGVCILAFGVIGFVQTWSDPWIYFSQPVFWISTNNILNVVSVVFGVALITSAFLGGNLPSYVDTAIGTMFMLNGLFWLMWLRTPPVNVLHFTMTNVVFSFVVGTIILTCGLYGRTASSEEKIRSRRARLD